ncbi:MAG: MqnA/MqnD/SBP family protein [Candidatus Kapaibacteriales bacterium]
MIKIAFPNNVFYENLFTRADDFAPKNNIRIYKLSENGCTDYLLRNLVDCAFLSPLGYGQAIKIVDLRIVPGPMLFASDYTGLASIFFRQGVDKIETIITNSSDDFIVLIGKLVLKEKFGIDANLKQIKGSKEDLLQNFDSAILWGKSKNDEITLDVSEEWFDLVEEPLPLGFWVVRAEEYPPNILNIVKALSIENLPLEEEIIENLAEGIERPSRKGKIIWQWREDLEDAIFSALMFLYYYQILPEIPAVKILGRD